MKLLKKINKGFALTIIILIILVIYLITVELKRQAEKPEIEEICKEYIDVIDKYIVMPENMQKLYSANLSNEEKLKVDDEVKKQIDLQMDKLEEELKTKMIDNELGIKMQKDTTKRILENSNDVYTSVVTSLEKRITKINKFTFDEDQVTVTFRSDVEKEMKYLDENEEENKELSKKEKLNITDETITLKKVNDTWKVVYADLQYQDYSENFTFTSMSY